MVRACCRGAPIARVLGSSAGGRVVTRALSRLPSFRSRGAFLEAGRERAIEGRRLFVMAIITVRYSLSWESSRAAGMGGAANGDEGGSGFGQSRSTHDTHASRTILVVHTYYGYLH